MRIAINLLFDGAEATGAGLYGFRLAQHLALRYPEHEIIACVHPANCTRITQWPRNLSLLYGHFPRRRRMARRLWEQLVLPLQLLIHGVDVVHSVDNTGLLLCPCRQVISVLDVTYLRYPRLRFERTKRLWYQFMVPASLRRARQIIALSAATAEDLALLLGSSTLNVQVTVSSSGIDPPVTLAPGQGAALRRVLGIGTEPYILAVGTQEPIKDHVTLIRAFALLNRHNILTPRLLVIVGREERATATLLQLRHAMGLTDNVLLTGYVPSDTLAALYAGASLFVSSSLHEGFGLTPLEAMSYGVPVVATMAGPAREILGDAALLVPVGDAAAMAVAMERILSDARLRQTLATRGHAVAARYTWEQCAASAMAIYEMAMAPQSP